MRGTPAPCRIPGKSGPRQVKILVVGNSSAQLSRLTSLIRGLGHHCDVITDPQAALDLVGAGALSAGVVIVEELMPHVGGIDLAMTVRWRCPSSKIVLMSSYLDQHVGEVERLVFDAFLEKPVTLEAVEAMLDSVRPHDPESGGTVSQ